MNLDVKNNRILFWAVISISVVCGLTACSSTPSQAELPVIQRYQSTDNYGALSIKIDKSIAGNSQSEQFIRWSEDYARQRGVTLISESELTAADSQIILQPALEDTFIAVLFRNHQQVDQFSVALLEKQNAQLIIDEMLLLWHPPDRGRKRREPVPEYALKPAFYKVSKDSFLKLMVNNNIENSNVGHQAWYQMDSRTPTFSWEAFPREWDIPPGFTKEDFKNVHYEFRLRPARALLVGFVASDTEGIEIGNLSEPQVTLEQKLPYCRQFMWTVRAVFELNCVPRQTEWAGAYNLYPSFQEQPWVFRRNLQHGLKFPYLPDSYNFAVRTPKNPFAEECVYQ